MWNRPFLFYATRSQKARCNVTVTLLGCSLLALGLSLQCITNKTDLMEELTALLEECSAAFKETEEYRILSAYTTRDSRFTFDERLAITKSVEQTFKPFFDKMKADVPTLSDTDLLFCALSTQGLDTVAIAECFSVTKEAVRIRKYRLREKLSDKWFTLLFGETKRYNSASVTLHIEPAPETEIPLPTEPIKNAKVMKEKMTFGKAVASCFSKLFTFKGRARRSEYWYFMLFLIILQSVIMAGGELFDTMTSIGQSQGADVTIKFAGSYLQRILLWVLYFMGLTVTVRRLHDIDCNGWFVLLLYILPIIIMEIESASFNTVGQSFDSSVVAPNVVAGAFKSHVIIMYFVVADLIASLIIFCKPGTEGPNSYGADPIRSISQTADEK